MVAILVGTPHNRLVCAGHMSWLVLIIGYFATKLVGLLTSDCCQRPLLTFEHVVVAPFLLV